MSETHPESPQQDAENDSAGSKKTPRTPAKRKSKLEREREESEEIIKSMGGAVEEGGRRTRSSARGSAPSTPAPATPVVKKPRVSRGRGKPKKMDVDDEGNDEDQQEQPNEEKKITENDDVSMKEVDDKTSNDVKSNDAEENVEKVEQPKENDTDAAVPKVDNSIADERAKTPIKNDTAPQVDAIETPKADPPPAQIKDSPVKRPVEEAAIPDAAKEPSEVNEKASHVNNVSDNKTDESKDDAPANAEPTIKTNESVQEVAAL